MIFLVIAAVLMPTVLAAPLKTPEGDAQAEITSFENTNDGTGNYHFRYETSNGLAREETGSLVNAGQTDAHIEVHGSYSYTDPDGVLHTIFYTADENGYHIEKQPTIIQIKPTFEPFPGVVVAAPLPASAVATLLGG